MEVRDEGKIKWKMRGEDGQVGAEPLKSTSQPLDRYIF